MSRWICQQEGAEAVGGEVEVNGGDLTFDQFIKFLKEHNHMSKGVATALQVKGATSSKVHASRGQAGVAATTAEEVPALKGVPHSGGGGSCGVRGPLRLFTLCQVG